jgi:hypothetical protein
MVMMDQVLLKPSEVLASILSTHNQRLINHTVRRYTDAGQKLFADSSRYPSELGELQRHEGYVNGLKRALELLQSDNPAYAQVQAAQRESNARQTTLRIESQQRKERISELCLYLGLDEAAFLAEACKSWRNSSAWKHLAEVSLTPEQALYLNVIQGQAYWFTRSHVLQISQCSIQTLETLVAYPLNMHRDSHANLLQKKQAKGEEVVVEELVDIHFV